MQLPPGRTPLADFFAAHSSVAGPAALGGLLGQPMAYPVPASASHILAECTFSSSSIVHGAHRKIFTPPRRTSSPPGAKWTASPRASRPAPGSSSECGLGLLWTACFWEAGRRAPEWGLPGAKQRARTSGERGSLPHAPRPAAESLRRTEREGHVTLLYRWGRSGVGAREPGARRGCVRRGTRIAAHTPRPVAETLGQRPSASTLRFGIGAVRSSPFVLPSRTGGHSRAPPQVSR